jgi:protein-export membrane protein SecD
LIASLLLGFFVYSTEQGDSPYGLQYGLDLSGGTHLIYDADVSELGSSEVDPAMASLRDVIERRVNAFGVSEPLVQVEESGAVGGETQQRLIVELPGIEDAGEAKEQIGETPVLDFRLQNNPSGGSPNQQLFATSSDSSTTSTSTQSGTTTDQSSQWTRTDLTGQLLSGARLQFGSGQQSVANDPVVLLDFNNEGAELFAEITGNNTGEILGIFLDGEPISTPTIQQQITGGTAQITGNFTPEEAQTLVRDLNLGALPVPIELVSTQTIGASLGEEVRGKGIYAGIVGLILVAIFMLGWYRLQGLVAVGALGVYILIMLAIFKLLPVTLTAAGIAGFILSIGMAVDANVLIFERVKEELRDESNSMKDVIEEGFSRAWPSIRDANISSMITAVILYMIGTTLTQGFAVTFGLGVLVSMISAVAISRTFLLALGGEERSQLKDLLFMPGFRTESAVNESSN